MPYLIQLLSRRLTQEVLIGFAEMLMMMLFRYEFMKLYKKYRNPKQEYEYPYNYRDNGVRL
jgi:hypothetical protein